MELFLYTNLLEKYSSENILAEKQVYEHLQHRKICNASVWKYSTYGGYSSIRRRNIYYFTSVLLSLWNQCLYNLKYNFVLFFSPLHNN